MRSAFAGPFEGVLLVAGGRRA